MEKEEWLLNRYRVSSGCDGNIWKWIEVMTAQHHVCSTHHWIVNFKMVNLGVGIWCSSRAQDPKFDPQHPTPKKVNFVMWILPHFFKKLKWLNQPRGPYFVLPPQAVCWNSRDLSPGPSTSMCDNVKMPRPSSGVLLPNTFNPLTESTFIMGKCRMQN